MEISFVFSEDNSRILAIYFKSREGDVARTIEHSEDECFVDVDESGSPLEVEMLVPGQLYTLAQQVASRFNLPEILTAVSEIKDSVAA